MTVRFSNRLVAELYQPFWAAWQGGEFMTDASAVAGTYRKRGLAWLRQAGGVRPRRGRNLQGRYLSFAEREEIALARAAGESMRSIAERLGRSPSTISRELGRNVDRAGRYRATAAHAVAYERASRPKPAKLVTNRVLREKVQADLQKRYSPEQIAGRLRVEFPDEPEMWVSTETIYQSLYVQSRGALRRELTRCLRTGRALRRPAGKLGQRKNRILPDMVNISERPAEAADRAVPGHWEGDLIIGKRTRPRSAPWSNAAPGTRCWCTCPTGTSPSRSRPPSPRRSRPCPRRCAGSLDLGPRPGDARLEAGRHRRRHRDLLLRPALALAARHQREHQRPAAPVLPERHDLSVHSEADLDWVAAELNDRPRKRLGFRKPIEQISELLLQP